MPPSGDDFGALVIRHLVEIAAGQCTITPEEILAYEGTDHHPQAEVLTGLLYLHQDLAYREGELARKNMELAEREAFARSVTEAASDGIVSADAGGQIVGWNRGAEDLFGYSLPEVLGQPLTLLMPERYRKDHLLGLARVTKTGVSRIVGRSLELDGQKKNGREFPIELRVHSWTAEGKQFFTGIIRDITERKRRDTEILKLNEELEAFAYSVSHDLRAPLRAIDGYSRLVLEECQGKIDPESSGHLQIVRESAQRMGTLIDDLLEFSRMGRTALKPSALDMRELAQSALRPILAENGGREIDVTLGDLPPTWADRSLLKQVFVNLLDNAVKYTRSRPVARIDIGGRSTDLENIYWIRDNGVGFETEYTHKLFGVFQRLHPRAEFEGTGVGLALVKRIITRHLGRVWAEGAVNQGAAFYFSLPRKGERDGGV